MENQTSGQGRRSDWTDLFRCFRLATDPAKMWLGLLGTAFTVLMLLLALFLVLEALQLMGGRTSGDALRHFRSGNFAAMYRVVGDGFDTTLTDVKWDIEDIRDSLFTGELMPALGRARTIGKVVPWALFVLLLLWIPWAYFGGAINRAAAVEYATGERVPTAEAREFAASRYGSYWWPPATVVLIIAGLFGCAAVIALAAAHLLSAVALAGGVLGSLYALVVVKQRTESAALGSVAGLSAFFMTLLVTWLLRDVRAVWLDRLVLVAAFPVLIVLGIAAVLLFIILVFGRGLMMSTVSYESTDAFDAISRGGDYVLKRPWHLGFYTLVAAAYGAPCVVLVAFVALAGFVVASVAAWVGFGGPFVGMYNCVLGPKEWTSLAEFLPGFLLCVIFVLLCGLVVGWCVAFVQAFRAICYALIRKRVDLSDTCEIYLEADRTFVPPAPDDGAGGDAASQPQQ